MFDFSNTHWSLISAVRRGRPDTADERSAPDEALRAWEEAWAYLRTRFEPALRVVARKSLQTYGGPPDHDADVVQDFFRACVQKQWLQPADPAFGRFRTFAFVLLRRYTRKYVDALRAKKRRPPGGLVSMDDVLQGYHPSAPPAEERGSLEAWLRCLLTHANETVRRENAVYGRINTELIRDPGVSNAELVERLGWAPDTLAVRKFRARRALRRALRTQIEQTVRSEADLSAELAVLMPLLKSHGLAPD